MRDEVKEFYVDFDKVKACDNIKIDYILVSREFNDLLLPRSGYDLLSKKEYGKEKIITDDNIQASKVGEWEGKAIYRTYDGFDKYSIKTTKLYSICSSCLNEELYNEQKDEYYCPSCLEHQPWHYRISNLYGKVKSYLPERVKQ